MADAAMSTVVNKLTELAGQEVRLLLQVVKDVKFLGDKFEWLQALLNDAEQQRRTSKNPFVALWIRQARDTAFEVEDVLDEFSRKVEKAKLSGYGKWKDVLKFQWATDCFTGVWVTHGLSRKIANIKAKLEELDTNKMTYNIELHPSSSSWAPSFNKTIPTWANNDSEAPVGLDSQVQELIKQLKDDADQRKIISIVGHNGSGRSMLAKKAYDSCEIQSHFEVVAWKTLPPMFRLKETLTDIYWKILEQEGILEEDCTQKDMREELCGLLRRRRYLIVLNGIESLVYWKKIILSKYLPDDNNGSRIILIPRIGSEIARLSKIEGVTAFEQMLSFSTDESFELFGQRFPEKSFYPINYGEYIRQVHKVTNGHPMTIVLLAGLLGSKEVSDWEKVFEHLKASKEAYRIDRMLSLCFDDLPHQLKSCFLYFAAVPQSTGIEASQLVRIWTAEGFIQPKSGKRMEEVGEGYLKELISRSLVRIEEKDEFGGPAVVAVDSHIHSFLLSEAQESSFVEIHDNTDLVSPAKVRRLSIQNYTHKHVQINNSLPKLRTLLCDCLEKQTVDSKLHRMRFLLKSKYLRVIDLHGLNIKELPGGISNMIHLRYLGIRCRGFEELPSSIGKLLNLQTLDIRKSSVKNVPDSFWRIPTLRHILSDHVKLPQHLGEHIHLQTLQTADCTNWNLNKYRLLEKISNIRILKLEKLSKDQVENIQLSVSNLQFLRHLSLKVREDESLSTRIFTNSSLRCVQSMELHGQLQDLQPDKDFDVRYYMPNLISLTLIMSNLGQNFINHLSKLPSLTRLCLLKSYNEKNIEFCPHGFQNLQELKLSGLNELEEWKEVTEDALPKLKKLILIGCTKLKSFPKGLQNLRLLEEMVIYDMDEIIRGIRDKTGDNYEKIKNVKTIKCRRDSSVDYSSLAGNV